MIADVHEPHEIVELLEARGVEVEVRSITPGDYIIGEVGIERKTVADFFSSMIRKRLFEQLGRLREYRASLLILEGDLSEISRHKNPASVWGALLSLTLDLEVHVIPSSSHEQTADILATLERRQGKERRVASLRFKPKNLSLRERQMFLVQGLPGVGEKLSGAILELFSSVRSAYAATEKELRRVEGIGEKKAREIRELLDAPFEGTQKYLK